LEVELGAKVSADSSTKYKKRSNARNGPFSTYSRLSTCLAAAWRRPGRILKDVRAERPKFVHHLQTISAAASGLLCMVMLVWGLQSQGVMPDTADLFGTVAKYDFTYPEMHRAVNESLVMDTLEAKAEASDAAELLLSRLVRSVNVVKEQNQVCRDNFKSMFIANILERANLLETDYRCALTLAGDAKWGEVNGLW
jgi:hypothetical protein